MRIPMNITDLPIVKRAVKIIRKAAEPAVKHLQALDSLSIALGYFDYKQLERLTQRAGDIVNTTTPIDIEFIHQQLTPWLTSILPAHEQSSNLLEKLNLSKLSVLASSPREKVYIMDEFSTYLGAARASNDEPVVELLRAVGISTFEWMVIDANPDPSIKNVIKLDWLIKRVKAILLEPPFAKLNHQEIKNSVELSKSLFCKITYDAQPQSMTSALSLIKLDRDIAPFGFRRVHGMIDGKMVFALHNPSLHAFMPQAFQNEHDVEYALAQIISNGFILPDNNLNDLNGVATFDVVLYRSAIRFSNSGTEPVTVNIKQGQIVGDISQLIDVKHSTINSPVSHAEPNKLSSNDDATAALMQQLPVQPLPLQYPALPLYESLSYPVVSKSNLALLLNSSHYLGGLAHTVREQLPDNSDCYARAISLITSHIAAETVYEGVYINTEDVDAFNLAFPALLNHYPLAQVDDWHDKVAEQQGFRVRGSIYVSEQELVAALLWQVLANQFPSKDFESDCANLAVMLLDDKYKYSLSDIKALTGKVRRCFDDFEHDIEMISGLNSGYEQLAANSGFVCHGQKKRLMSDIYRLGRKYNPTITQSLNNFSEMPVKGDWERYAKLQEHKKLTVLPASYQDALNGLLAQAQVVSSALPGRPDKEELAKAQKGMARHPKATQTIIKVLLALDMSVDNYDVNEMIAWLKQHDINCWHLNDKPAYFSASKTIDGVEYYYITSYYGDVDGCAGHEYSIDSAITFMESQQLQNPTVHINILNNDRIKFLSTLEHPELVFNIKQEVKLLT